MNTITISNASLPIVTSCGFRIAASPFYHADRTVDFNILIYVTKGVIYVTEEDTDYSVESGELPKKICGLTGTAFEKKIINFSDYYNSNDDMNIWYAGMKFLDVLTGAAFLENMQKETVADKIAEYLTENYKAPFDTKLLSEKFFLSYKRLAAIFKTEKGISMQQFHNKVRMNEACRLLSSTVMPVGNIAGYVGFSDILYFSRCFKDFTGICPTKYRKTHRQY